MENPTEIDDFGGTPILGNPHNYYMVFEHWLRPRLPSQNKKYLLGMRMTNDDKYPQKLVLSAQPNPCAWLSQFSGLWVRCCCLLLVTSNWRGCFQVIPAMDICQLAKSYIGLSGIRGKLQKCDCPPQILW